MKNAMSILVAIFILLLTQNTVSANVIGDINGDSVVGLPEALFALQVAAGLHPGFPETCVLTGAGIWETGKNYLECDVVSLGDNFYVALAANTSVVENSPDVDTDTWAPLPLEGEPGPIAGTDKQFVYNDNGEGAGAEVYYDNTTSMVGIGTSNPEFKLTLDNDGGILAKGTFESGAALTTSGEGARLIWYPRKAAFRVGYAGETSWDDSNIGEYSTAMGRETTASGKISTAMGRETTASGIRSTAMGTSTTASGDLSTAMGVQTTASGEISTAMGLNTTASGDHSTAMGLNTTASGNVSTAIGNKTTASGGNSTAMGLNTTASGDYSTAIGKGYNNYNRLENNQADSFMVGYMNSETDTEPELFVKDGAVGIGTSNPAGTLDVNGPIYQSGEVLHADYVFEPDYVLESIEEHASFMWREKHLKAVPGAKYDEDGREVLEVGAHRRGILEELEKAHIYIARLNDTIKSQQAAITEQRKIIGGLQSAVCRLQPEARICAD